MLNLIVFSILYIVHTNAETATLSTEAYTDDNIPQTSNDCPGGTVKATFQGQQKCVVNGIVQPSTGEFTHIFPPVTEYRTQLIDHEGIKDDQGVFTIVSPNSRNGTGTGWPQITGVKPSKDSSHIATVKASEQIIGNRFIETKLTVKLDSADTHLYDGCEIQFSGSDAGDLKDYAEFIPNQYAKGYCHGDPDNVQPLFQCGDIPGFTPLERDVDCANEAHCQNAVTGVAEFREEGSCTTTTSPSVTTEGKIEAECGTCNITEYLREDVCEKNFGTWTKHTWAPNPNKQYSCKFFIANNMYLGETNIIATFHKVPSTVGTGLKFNSIKIPIGFAPGPDDYDYQTATSKHVIDGGKGGLQNKYFRDVAISYQSHCEHSGGYIAPKIEISDGGWNDGTEGNCRNLQNHANVAHRWFECTTSNKKHGCTFSDVGTVNMRLTATFLDPRYKVVSQAGVERLEKSIGNFLLVKSGMELHQDYRNFNDPSKDSFYQGNDNTLQLTPIPYRFKKTEKTFGSSPLQRFTNVGCELYSRCLGDSSKTDATSCGNAGGTWTGEYPNVQQTVTDQNVYKCDLTKGVREDPGSCLSQYAMTHTFSITYGDLPHFKPSYIGCPLCNNEIVIKGFKEGDIYQIHTKIPIHLETTGPFNTGMVTNAEATNAIDLPSFELTRVADQALLKPNILQKMSLIFDVKLDEFNRLKTAGGASLVSLDDELDIADYFGQTSFKKPYILKNGNAEIVCDGKTMNCTSGTCDLTINRCVNRVDPAQQAMDIFRYTEGDNTKFSCNDLRKANDTGYVNNLKLFRLASNTAEGLKTLFSSNCKTFLPKNGYGSTYELTYTDTVVNRLPLIAPVREIDDRVIRLGGTELNLFQRIEVASVYERVATNIVLRIFKTTDDGKGIIFRLKGVDSTVSGFSDEGDECALGPKGSCKIGDANASMQWRHLCGECKDNDNATVPDGITQNICKHLNHTWALGTFTPSGINTQPGYKWSSHTTRQYNCDDGSTGFKCHVANGTCTGGNIDYNSITTSLECVQNNGNFINNVCLTSFAQCAAENLGSWSIRSTPHVDSVELIPGVGEVQMCQPDGITDGEATQTEMLLVTPRTNGEGVSHKIRTTKDCRGTVDFQFEDQSLGQMFAIYTTRIPCSRVSSQSLEDRVDLKYKYETTLNLASDQLEIDLQYSPQVDSSGQCTDSSNNILSTISDESLCTSTTENTWTPTYVTSGFFGKCDNNNDINSNTVGVDKVLNNASCVSTDTNYGFAQDKSTHMWEHTTSGVGGLETLINCASVDTDGNASYTETSNSYIISYSLAMQYIRNIHFPAFASNLSTISNSQIKYCQDQTFTATITRDATASVVASQVKAATLNRAIIVKDINWVGSKDAAVENCAFGQFKLEVLFMVLDQDQRYATANSWQPADLTVAMIDTAGDATNDNHMEIKTTDTGNTIIKTPASGPDEGATPSSGDNHHFKVQGSCIPITQCLTKQDGTPVPDSNPNDGNSWSDYSTESTFDIVIRGLFLKAEVDTKVKVTTNFQECPVEETATIDGIPRIGIQLECYEPVEFQASAMQWPSSCIDCSNLAITEIETDRSVENGGKQYADGMYVLTDGSDHCCPLDCTAGYADDIAQTSVRIFVQNDGSSALTHTGYSKATQQQWEFEETKVFIERYDTSVTPAVLKGTAKQLCQCDSTGCQRTAEDAAYNMKAFNLHGDVAKGCIYGGTFVTSGQQNDNCKLVQDGCVIGGTFVEAANETACANQNTAGDIEYRWTNGLSEYYLKCGGHTDLTGYNGGKDYGKTLFGHSSDDSNTDSSQADMGKFQVNLMPLADAPADEFRIRYDVVLKTGIFGRRRRLRTSTVIRPSLKSSGVVTLGDSSAAGIKISYRPANAIEGPASEGPTHSGEDKDSHDTVHVLLYICIACIVLAAAAFVYYKPCGSERVIYTEVPPEDRATGTFARPNNPRFKNLRY
jgi:hypothetical protein